MGAHLEDVVVQFLPVQGFSHKHFTNGVIAGDNLKSPSNVTRSQGEDHLWEERERWLVRLKGCLASVPIIILLYWVLEERENAEERNQTHQGWMCLAGRSRGC